jgi:3-dehydroquinate synthase class II
MLGPPKLPPPAQVGRLVRVANRADVEAAASLAGAPGVVVMDATDWQSIPAENLVAAFAVRSHRSKPES